MTRDNGPAQVAFLPLPAVSEPRRCGTGPPARSTKPGMSVSGRTALSRVFDGASPRIGEHRAVPSGHEGAGGPSLLVDEVGVRGVVLPGVPHSMRINDVEGRHDDALAVDRRAGRVEDVLGEPSPARGRARAQRASRSPTSCLFCGWMLRASPSSRVTAMPVCGTARNVSSCACRTTGYRQIVSGSLFVKFGSCT